MRFETDIPEGQSGQWKVERFTVSQEEAKSYNLVAQIQAMQGRPFRPIEPGNYVRLKRGEQVVMTNTPSELEDLEFWPSKVTGQVLINGLGLGIVAEMALQKPEVVCVTVIEIDKDVIKLVYPYLQKKYGDKIEFHWADAFGWNPPRGVRYNVVWHDIWDNICSDNLEGMKKLKRKYAKRADWQGVWAYIEHLQVKRAWG